MNILILNGPNLNLLGKREVNIYGNQSFESYFEELKTQFPTLNLSYKQSNHEGVLIDLLHQYGFDAAVDRIVLNAGGLTHTSVALRDAISAISCPVFEVHLSNIYAREPFRQHSLLSAVCQGVVCGFGLNSYRLTLEGIVHEN
ncbi:MAG: type II 3-dehydroquinate dehydratase [Flavobacteriales bacterium]